MPTNGIATDSIPGIGMRAALNGGYVVSLEICSCSNYITDEAPCRDRRPIACSKNGGSDERYNLFQPGSAQIQEYRQPYGCQPLGGHRGAARPLAAMGARAHLPLCIQSMPRCDRWHKEAS